MPDPYVSIALLSPDEPGFWNHVTAQPEFLDGGPDPLDRWSARVVQAVAQTLDAMALLPFGGPPYRPFVTWALRSGRAHGSPVSLLVHDRMGLMASWRGALALKHPLPATPAPAPCRSCATQPCRTACPVNALAEDHYDLDRCHGFLDTPEGRDCMDSGCSARRACPASRRYGRLVRESAHHMRHFHK
ncbi:ferredoxin [Frigidibacter sp. ROC022]|uniref:ferredoxin n=1 Tax=Frigidibacter sp. ROC022 TaxID=2971796 RepID=UPI00215B2A4D|nr:ferredoxin [Frigidibacter sp. ROC022]MCR8725913.1 ferredoxin [Frigidibacter sp. ROC022]